MTRFRPFRQVAVDAKSQPAHRVENSHAGVPFCRTPTQKNHRFRPLWLRSSVVSVLQSLTTLTPGTSRAKLSTLFLELGSLKGSACRPLPRVGLVLQYRQERPIPQGGELNFANKRWKLEKPARSRARCRSRTRAGRKRRPRPERPTGRPKASSSCQTTPSRSPTARRSTGACVAV